ncbi:uncharacterized protein LOC126481653 [Schistocerca serialis cubense]|uniref:uncharacterized protein LOC126481653 n=1 Tax=Schistocerca serialis cubense TaxID=2023355 RepID=UPI00214E94E4|nr:uncharacterized protein LOC126481653 [Schistocerca serialis cubense]
MPSGTSVRPRKGASAFDEAAPNGDYRRPRRRLRKSTAARRDTCTARTPARLHAYCRSADCWVSRTLPPCRCPGGCGRFARWGGCRRTGACAVAPLLPEISTVSCLVPYPWQQPPFCGATNHRLSSVSSLSTHIFYKSIIIQQPTRQSKKQI